MFASEGNPLHGNVEVVYTMLIPLLLFFIVNFALCRLASRWAGLSYEDSASLVLTTMTRNSPVSLAIAVAAFPETPLIALVLVVGPLIELPDLGLVSQALLLIKEKQVSK